MKEPNANPLEALLLDALSEPALEDEREPQLAPPRPEVRASLLSAVAGGTGEPPFSGFLRRFSRLFELSAPAASQILLRMSEPEVWLTLGSVRLYNFAPGPSLEGAYAAIFRCDAGAPFPTHRHGGKETTLCLAGLVRDEDSQKLLFPGDVVSMEPGTIHRLSILPPHECVFALLLEGGYPEFE